jgi:hypothetical protein
MTGRAYGRSTESRYHQARIRAENEHRRAVANRCTRRPRSTAANPLPHVWQGVGADVMGCKHCPRVRQLTNAEYRAKYGIDLPPPRPATRRQPLWLWPMPAISCAVIAWSGSLGVGAVLVAGAGMLLLTAVWVGLR